jgi:hypothetical protein
LWENYDASLFVKSDLSDYVSIPFLRLDRSLSREFDKGPHLPMAFPAGTPGASFVPWHRICTARYQSTDLYIRIAHVQMPSPKSCSPRQPCGHAFG